MTAPCPTIRALRIEVVKLCGVLDVIASRQPDGPVRCAIEEVAAAARARALVAADRAARESASWVRA